MATDQSSANTGRLSNYPSISRTTVHGSGSLLFSLPFLGAGAAIVLVALDMIQVDPSKIHCPRWVLGAAGGVFFVAGLAVFVHSIAGMRRLARLKANAAAHPDQPALADYEWNPVGIESRQMGSLLGHAFMLLMVGGLLAVMNWAAFSGKGGIVFKIVAGFFDLIFAGVGVALVKMIIARFKYGRPVLEFAEFPFRPGKPLRLRAVSQQDVGEAESFVATLRYVEEVYETHGKGKNRRQVVVNYERYADKLELHGSDARKIATGGLELEFRLPENAASNNLRGRPASFWDLELRAEVPGVDFVHRFLVPVYGEAEFERRVAA